MDNGLECTMDVSVSHVTSTRDSWNIRMTRHRVPHTALQNAICNPSQLCQDSPWSSGRLLGRFSACHCLCSMCTVNG